MLTWADGRWHCDGEGIHAGNRMELRGDTGWIPVRIESGNQGRKLFAYAVLDGQTFSRAIHPESDELRWPR